MVTVKVKTSMGLVPCELLKSRHGMYLVSYYRDWEYHERWVSREDLVFPKFYEYGTL